MISEIPEGWQRVRLGDVADITMGQSPPGKTVLEWDGGDCATNGLPFVQGNAEFGSKHPKPVKWCVEPVKVIDADAFLISIRAPVGQTSRVDKRLSIGRGLAAIRFTSAHRSFGWHALNQNKHSLQRVSQGSTFKAIGRGELSCLLVLLPPLPEQRAIAVVLDSIDEAIERTETLIAATEDLRESLRHELFARGIPGWHSEYREVPSFGTVPVDWEVVRLGDVASLSQGGTPRKSNPQYWGSEFPFVTGADLIGIDISRRNARAFLTMRGLNSGETAVCPAGSLLLATRTRVGLAGIAKETLGASQDITRVSCHPQLNSRFLCRSLLQKAVRLQRLARGTTIQGITRNDVASFPILLPPLPEQRAIAEGLDSVDNVLEQLKRERDSRAELKKSVAEALLTGRVRVGTSA